MISADIKKEGYRRALKDGKLYLNALNNLLDLLRKVAEKNRMQIDDVPEELLERGEDKITKLLTNLKLCVIKGNRSWGGLIVGFPGSKKELYTYSVGTPYLRKILYPILELYKRLNKQAESRCLYILGARFSDVFLRKFRLLKSIIPHVIIITDDLMKCANNVSKSIIEKKSKITEKWIQGYICKKMRSPDVLNIPVEGGSIETGFIAYEVPAYEGTLKPEKLDILGYDKNDHSLIAFEIKGPECDLVELKNLFLQGIEHRNWLEENKMAIKFLFEGPKGKKIYTTKRVRLILGFCGEKVPPLFFKLRKQAMRKDPFLKIDFCRFKTPSDINGELCITSFLSNK